VDDEVARVIVDVVVMVMLVVLVVVLDVGAAAIISALLCG